MAKEFGSLELAVLSLMRRKRHYLKYKDLLATEFFSSIEAKTIYKMIRSYHDKGGGQFLVVKNLWILLEKYIDEDDYAMYRKLLTKIRALKDVDETAVRLSIIKFAKNFKIRSLIQHAANQVQGNMDVDVQDLRKRVDDIISLNGIRSEVDYNYFSQSEARLKEDVSAFRVPTGLSSAIDDSMLGGLGPGELGFFMAPPKRGKTFALVNVGANALYTGKRVLHATLEIQAKAVARRYDCCLTRATWYDVVQDKSLVADMRKKLEKLGSELVIKDYSYQHCSVGHLGSLLEREREMGVRPFDLIVVDFADLMVPPERKQDTRHELLRIYEELRILAGAFKVPVWTASQGNRGSVMKRRVDIDDLAEAFGKAGIADIVISLCQSPEEKEEKIMRLFVAANRIGPGNPMVSLMADTDRMLLLGEDAPKLNKRTFESAKKKRGMD